MARMVNNIGAGIVDRGVVVFSDKDIDAATALLWKPENVRIAGMFTCPRTSVIRVRRASPEEFRRMSAERHKLTQQLGSLMNFLEQKTVQDKIEEISRRMAEFGAKYHIGQTLFDAKVPAKGGKQPFIQIGSSGNKSSLTAGDEFLVISLGVSTSQEDAYTQAEIVTEFGVIDVLANSKGFSLALAGEDGLPTGGIKLPEPAERSPNYSDRGFTNSARVQTSTITTATKPAKSKRV